MSVPTCTAVQRDGLATRLLDWSVNPLTALWFCVCKPAAPNEPGVVWLMHPQSEDYVSPAVQTAPTRISRVYVLRVLRSRMVAPQIRAQAGWFTVHHFDSDQEKFIALKNDAIYGPRLTKLIIPGDAFANIRFQLDRLEVNAFRLSLKF